MTSAGSRGGDQEIPRPPGARPGGPAPWARLASVDRAVGMARVRQSFEGARPPRPSPFESDPQARPSAVLAPLFEEEGEVWVVLTRRSWHLRAHRGEVSFPGGGQDPDDEDLVATALREAWEEIGLDPRVVEVLGELDHLSTVSSRAFIVPYVGALPARPELRPNPNEVEAVLAVPLAELLGDDVYREEIWSWQGMERSIYFFELVGDTVWGATAAMLRQLLALVLGIHVDPGVGR